MTMYSRGKKSRRATIHGVRYVNGPGGGVPGVGGGGEVAIQCTA